MEFRSLFDPTRPSRGTTLFVLLLKFYFFWLCLCPIVLGICRQLHGERHDIPGLSVFVKNFKLTTSCTRFRHYWSVSTMSTDTVMMAFHFMFSTAGVRTRYPLSDFWRPDCLQLLPWTRILPRLRRFDLSDVRFDDVLCQNVQSFFSCTQPIKKGHNWYSCVSCTSPTKAFSHRLFRPLMTSFWNSVSSTPRIINSIYQFRLISVTSSHLPQRQQ